MARTINQIVQDAEGTTGKELAAYVAELAESYPKVHDQGSVAVGLIQRPSALQGQRGLYRHPQSRRRTCGTTACLAGWTVVLHRGSLLHGDEKKTGRLACAVDSPRGVLLHAMELLGIEPNSDEGVRFHSQVFVNMDEGDAIHQLKVLTGITSEENV